MFDKLTDADQDLIAELELTALSPIDEQPVPGLVRAFSWLEQRRTERNWVLYELGLLLVRGKLMSRPDFAGLGAALLDEAKRRKSKWLDVLAQPLVEPRKFQRPAGARQPQRDEFADQRRAFFEGYDLGATFQMVPVIAFPSRKKKRLSVTVWGFKAGKARWPSAAETRERRRAVRSAK